MSMDLPSLIKLSASFEDLLGKSFSKVVGTLFCGCNLEDLDVPISNLIPKEVPFDIVVSSSAGDLVISCQSQCAAVVFVDCCANKGLSIAKGWRDADKFDEL